MALALTSLVGCACIAFLCYYTALIAYRIFLHPLAKFPGPKPTAASLWYEFYYDVVLRGQFIWKIQEWHEMYGPIVRINPDELHILDHEYYDEIYGSTTKKRDKYGPWVALAGTPGSSFSTVAHDHHRIRRGALNAFFSKKAVVALEPVVQSKVDILSRRFAKAEATGEVIRIDAAFMALTMDVICQYAFANDDAMLERDDFNVAWKEMIIGAFEGGALLRQFPGMIGMMNIVPDAMMGKMMPSMSLMLDWKHGVRGRIKPILERKEKETTSHRTIFHELRDDHDLPENEKTMDRLCDEGQIFTGAGSETTAKALTTALFYLLVKGDTFSILKKELLQAMPVGKTTSWQKLEQLPYLVPFLYAIVLTEKLMDEISLQ